MAWRCSIWLMFSHHYVVLNTWTYGSVLHGCRWNWDQKSLELISHRVGLIFLHFRTPYLIAIYEIRPHLYCEVKNNEGSRLFKVNTDCVEASYCHLWQAAEWYKCDGSLLCIEYADSWQSCLLSLCSFCQIFLPFALNSSIRRQC